MNKLDRYKKLIIDNYLDPQDFSESEEELIEKEIQELMEKSEQIFEIEKLTHIIDTLNKEKTIQEQQNKSLSDEVARLKEELERTRHG